MINFICQQVAAGRRETGNKGKEEKVKGETLTEAVCVCVCVCVCQGGH